MNPILKRSRTLLARPLPAALRARWEKLRRPLLWLALIGYFAFAGLFLTLRYAVLPHIADYRSDIEQAIVAAIKLPVAIGGIEADWQGLRPRLLLHDVRVADQAGRPALGFERIEAVVGWSSLWHFDLRLHRLSIDAPELNMRREADGRIFIAGLPLNQDDSEDARLSDWVLAQGQIVIRDATLNWDDALRQAPTLTLKKVNFNLRNNGRRHRFGLTAEPPAALATRLDMRADVRGGDLAQFDRWLGQLYAELDYADLAVWRTWVDYPITLTRGSGGLRLWMDFSAAQPQDKARPAEETSPEAAAFASRITAITADVALSDVQMRLGAKLPMLDLQRLHGRFSAQRDGGDFVAEGRKLALSTQAVAGGPGAIDLGPLDFRVALGMDETGRAERMDANFNTLDLGKLDALAAYLPLPEEYVRQLAKLELEGRIDELESRWDGRRQRYAIKGRFHDLGIASYDALPGVRKLSGSIDGTDTGGSIVLNSRNAQLSLPSVFPEPDIALNKLDAKLNWKRKDSKYDVNIETLSFANADAEGTAQGRYHGETGKPGSIDLNAQLKRAEGTAVWRYLPLAVNQDARDWVRQGILDGHSNDVKLVLKGDLAKFPFPDGSGTFKVLVKAHNATVRPTPAWPDITGIDGDLAFVGVGMFINAHKGQVLGASLSGVRAEIADLDSVIDQTLTISGKAKGPTQEFLNFIEASPVGERINHFTAPMAASGNGELDLKLKLTLHDLDQSTAEGSYLFDNNKLTPDPSLPQLTEVHGRLDFTGDGISVKEAHANMLGAPVVIKVATETDGRIEVDAAGQFNVAAMRKLYPMPLFDQLSGSGRWKGLFSIRKNDVDVRITSDLVGLTSNLPEPFNKTAAAPMELRIERKTLAPETAGKKPARAPAGPQREMQEIVLGKLLRAQFLRNVGASEIQRGYMALGNGAEAARLPERGVLFSADLARFDIDFWQRMLTSSSGNASKSAGKSPSKDSSLPFNQLDLRTNELVFLNRTLQDVRLNAQSSGTLWKADFRSKGVSAQLDWQPGKDGKPGRISGRIPQLTIPDPNQQVTEIARLQDNAGDQLPALALVIDNISVRGHHWGAVTLDAENRGGYWNAKFSVNNEDGSLSGDGRWRPDAQQHDTQINFRLKASSLEKLLARAGYADAIRRGTVNLEGNLDWNGSPLNIDYPTLNGKLKVDMQNGQFKKLEPGIGRLLGVLSLQSIPRRVTLDFRDIFSEGFAFDSIRGDVNVSQGVMETREFAIQGPAATVRMSGNVNLPAETQNLNVRVQPVLGDTLAVGAMIANPAIGAVAWLAHKVLKNPIDQAFAFEYQVTGKWEDPKVAKINTGRDINKAIEEEIAKQNPVLNKDAPKETERK
ncbi:MAG TPA: YhdP family protein [Rhodocyclaceae bacterium]|nr:YhdP family protein [Rhodocyclaceae bacterium]